MKLARFSIGILLTLLTVGGYLGSVFFVLSGRAVEWHAKMADPSISALAWVALLGVVVIGWLAPAKTEEELWR